MAFWLTLVGALLGAALSGAWGSLMGAVVGFAFGRYLTGQKRAQPTADASEPAAGPEAADVDFDVTVAEQLDLMQRVQRLETQVAELQATVSRLEGRLAAAGTAPERLDDAVPAASGAPEALHAARADAALAHPEPEAAAPVEEMAPALLAEAWPEPTPAHPDRNSATPDVPVSPVDLSASVRDASPNEDPAEWDWPEPAEVGDRRATGPIDSDLAVSRSASDLLPARVRELLFEGNTIVKVGVLILFLGLSFLLKHMAQEVTVPLAVRYAGVALMGVALLAVGWRVRHRVDVAGGRDYGLVLQGAGVGVFYLTTLAAMKAHALLSPVAGFALMVVVTILAVVLAVMQNAPWLAMVASGAGFLTPMLVSTGSGNHIALFSYLAVLDLGIFAVAWFRAWRPLNLIGFVGTFSLASAWALKHYTPALYASTQGFLLLFFLLFTAVGFLFAHRALAMAPDEAAGASLGERAAEALRHVGRVDGSLVFGVPLAAYSLQYMLVQHDRWLPALSALVMGLFYCALGAALWRGGQRRYALLAEAYVVVGVLFGTLSVPLALEGGWTGATWAVQAAGVYWLGARQHRAYSRACALILMAAAGVSMLDAMAWRHELDVPVLAGSMLGMALLAASGVVVGLVYRRAAQSGSGETRPPWEEAGVMMVWGIALAAHVALPWMWLMPLWASVVTSLLALTSLWLGDRHRIRTLQMCAPVVHVVALLGFAGTLHAGEGDAALALGASGLCAAVIIGVSLLGSAWLGVREIWARAAQDGAAASARPPRWPLGSSLALVAGLALISMSLLFLMPLARASLVWPLMGLGALWVSLKLAHPALAFTWGALHVAAVLAFMAFGPVVWPPLDAVAPGAGFRVPQGGMAFWTPLILAFSAVVSAAWLHQSARRAEGRCMPWASATWIQPLMLSVSAWWWVQTLPPELLRLLASRDALGWTAAVMSAWVTFTSILMLALAARLDWSSMGRAAGLTLPLWLAALVAGPVSQGGAPLAEMGWLVWPLALVWHPVALRQSARWWSGLPLASMHVAGLWLFGFIAARQLHWSVEQHLPAGSAWQAVGWLVVPLALSAALSARRWHGRWPMGAFPVAYRCVAALPWMMVLLGWWLWSLSHAGLAAPLPYVPLLNPLELAQALTMLVAAVWFAAMPAQSGVALPPRRAGLVAMGLAGLAWLTSMVLRACHHWAGVAWDERALFASRLAQASLSVTWALVGVGLMLLGHRRGARPVWLAGAALLAIVVAKLFFIELAHQGSLYRIVSFIVVGVLLLVVGYFAPVPPAEGAPPSDDADRVTPAEAA